VSQTTAINDSVDRYIQSVTATQERSEMRVSQTVTYDPAAIKALILKECGRQPKAGTPEADRWRVQADRIFNRELDLLRTASGASAGQTVTFKPIQEEPVLPTSDTSVD
jgi:hypothetical protein